MGKPGIKEAFISDDSELNWRDDSRGDYHLHCPSSFFLAESLCYPLVNI